MFVAHKTSVGVTLGSMHPTSVELKIYYMTLYAIYVYLLLPTLSRHIVHLVGARRVHIWLPCHIREKSPKRFR